MSRLAVPLAAAMLPFLTAPAITGEPDLTHPTVAKIEAAVTPDDPTQTIVHIRGWHLVKPAAFLADLRDQFGDDDDFDAAAIYARHLDDVEAVQTQQRAYLRHLVDAHGLGVVYQEGLTAGDMKTFRTMCALYCLRHKINGDLAEVTKDTVERRHSLTRIAANRPDLLRIGAAGQLYAEKVLGDVRPLDDAEAHAKANPVTDDGQVTPEVAAHKQRHDAMVKILAADDSPLIVIVLGGAHDLSAAVRRLIPRAAYRRVTLKGCSFD